MARNNAEVTSSDFYDPREMKSALVEKEEERDSGPGLFTRGDLFTLARKSRSALEEFLDVP